VSSEENNDLEYCSDCVNGIWYACIFVYRVMFNNALFRKKKRLHNIILQDLLGHRAYNNRMHNTTIQCIIYYSLVMISYDNKSGTSPIVHRRLRFSAVIKNVGEITITGRGTATCAGPRVTRSKLLRSEEFSMTPCNRLRTESSWSVDTRTNGTRSPPWIPRSAKTKKIQF